MIYNGKFARSPKTYNNQGAASSYWLVLSCVKPSKHCYNLTHLVSVWEIPHHLLQGEVQAPYAFPSVSSLEYQHRYTPKRTHQKSLGK